MCPLEGGLGKQQIEVALGAPALAAGEASVAATAARVGMGASALRHFEVAGTGVEPA